MSDIPTSVTAARSEKARLYIGNPSPNPDHVRRADTNLATAKIDKAIRQHIREAGAHLDRAQTAHLVGLLLMEAAVPGATVTLLESLVRLAVAGSADV